jgi:hypothetical protein
MEEWKEEGRDEEKKKIFRKVQNGSVMDRLAALQTQSIT